MKFLILFPSTYDALVAEKTWPQSGYSGKLRPIPRVLSSSCGLCLETELPDEVSPLEILGQLGLEWEQVVEACGKKYICLAKNT